jgi:hypothetical protein
MSQNPGHFLSDASRHTRSHTHQQQQTSIFATLPWPCTWTQEAMQGASSKMLWASKWSEEIGCFRVRRWLKSAADSQSLCGWTYQGGNSGVHFFSTQQAFYSANEDMIVSQCCLVVLGILIASESLDPFALLFSISCRVPEASTFVTATCPCLLWYRSSSAARLSLCERDSVEKPGSGERRVLKTFCGRCFEGI